MKYLLDEQLRIEKPYNNEKRYDLNQPFSEHSKAKMTQFNKFGTNCTLITRTIEHRSNENYYAFFLKR